MASRFVESWRAGVVSARVIASYPASLGYDGAVTPPTVAISVVCTDDVANAVFNFLRGEAEIKMIAPPLEGDRVIDLGGGGNG